MPWQQGFGTGGQQAWRDINEKHPSDIPPSLVPYERDGAPSSGLSYQLPQPSYPPEESSYTTSTEPLYGLPPPPGSIPYPPPSSGYPGQQYFQQQAYPPLGGYQQEAYQGSPLPSASGPHDEGRQYSGSPYFGVQPDYGGQAQMQGGYQGENYGGYQEVNQRGYLGGYQGEFQGGPDPSLALYVRPPPPPGYGASPPW